MVNRIFITGPVGSGKSTLARRIARDYGFDYVELDSVVHRPDSTSASRNNKRSEEERNALFNAALAKERWVLEDTGRRIFEEAWRLSDSIILLEPPVNIRKRRIFIRFIKQNLGLEKCGYQPGFWMLKAMYRWTANYESGNDDLKQRLLPYAQKVSVIRNEDDYRKYAGSFL